MLTVGSVLQIVGSEARCASMSAGTGGKAPGDHTFCHVALAPGGSVALLLVGKCFATTASVSSGSPGGVFTPTLLIGGSVGLLYAHALCTLGIATGPAPGYALVGMAAATAATTHAPLLAEVMVFELSGDYAVVLPLLTATAVATMVSRRLRSESVYAAELRRKGIRWELTMEGRKVVDP